MKRSTIWLLAVVMAVAFAGLLYLQVNYVNIILKTRNEQFTETVKQCLQRVSHLLELEETRQYLIDDIENTESYFIHMPAAKSIRESIDGGSSKFEILSFSSDKGQQFKIKITAKDYAYKIEQLRSIGAGKSNDNSIVKTSQELQRILQDRYAYQGGLIEEVILNILYNSNLKPIEERIDFNALAENMRFEFVNNGLELPFRFAVIDRDGKTVYQNGDVKSNNASDIITQVLFPNDPPSKLNYLKVYFPTKRNYISSSVDFLVPSVIFSMLILITFIITIYMVFRQKKLSEMKNDFINNMTHELKTPVSTISLAAQMLRDSDITKTPGVFKHVAGVINDETKRLGFLVEKVLQMSLFEREKATLKLKELGMNDLIENITNTFTLKVEKYGGTIETDLRAVDDRVYGDEFHLTNVLFNLMDNAVKYRKPEIPLNLIVTTVNESGKLLIGIEDNGIGMRKDQIKKIFDRFYRVPTGNVHDVKGFGLGLAYVRKIIEDHHGTIRAESELNVKTKFFIVLPIIK